MKTHDRSLFSDNVEWSSKKLWNVISADVEINVKQWELKEMAAVS